MNSNSDNAGESVIGTLEQSGAVPESRIGNAQMAQNIYQIMRRADDDGRGAKRAMVQGLIDGNPPYRQSDLRAAGQDYRCNINWRVAESYLASADGAFYDLYSEAPTFATIKLNAGTLEQQEAWSRSVTTHFDWLCRYEPTLDFHFQLSQQQMVLYGAGPMVFADELKWAPRAMRYGQLKVPDRTEADVSLWDVCAIEMDYTPDKLYESIKDSQAATQRGWNVSRTRQAIIDAHPDTQRGGLCRSWEWHQQQLKNGSLYYTSVSRKIYTVHLFWREFPKKGEEEGKISHGIIIRDMMEESDKWLFNFVGRYDNWHQCVHAMYFDRGSGGFHHGVTGMGTKMYSVMELENRLLCNLADKAWTPKVMFKPTTASAAEDFSLEQRGDHLLLSEGFDVVQTPISGVMEEGLTFRREISNQMSANLSQYRTDTSEPTTGNPDTATKVKLDASKEASLQKTQMARYYQQQDALYGEMYRRACLPGAGKRAKEFMERCYRDGVPAEAMKKVEYVKASRVVGQGSPFMREQALEKLWITVGQGLPEDGRTHLTNDIIAANTGQASVERYNPQKQQSQLPDDQTVVATGQVADMKIGVPAVPSSSQNPAIFATIFVKAADDAASTLEQGANPADVAAFLDLCGQAITIHLQRLARDPSRKALVKQIAEQLQKISKVHDQLVQHLQQQAQQQQEEQARMQAMQQQQNGELALAKQKQDAELAMKAQKLQFGLREKSAKTNQSMALNDATTASRIRLDQAIAEHEMALSKAREKNGSE